MTFLKIFFPIIVVLFITSLSVLPLLRPGFFDFHDFQHIARLFELDKTLKGGSFPVRWVEGLGFGFGYPLFNFYPPFVYYLGEAFHLIGFGFIDSIKIVWGIALVGSALAMYFLAEKFFGKIGGIVAAAFYLYAPYHAVDAYVRGALAELFSFLWLPLILLFSYQRKMVITGVLLGLLMITHNLVFLPFVGFYVLWVIFLERRSLVFSFLFLFKTLFIAFGLTSFFWLPSLAEKRFTLVDRFLTTGLANYRIHFVCLDQLWNSLWGYGGSVAGCIDGMSFKIGKLHILLAFLGLLIGLHKKFIPLLVVFGLFFLAIFMTTEVSKFIWDKISLLWYLQFPWRFLEFAALFSAFLTGGLFLIIKDNRKQFLLAGFLIGAVIFFNGKYFVPQNYLNDIADNTLIADEEIKWRVSQTSFEYMNANVAINPTKHGSYMLDIESFPTQKYLVLEGDFTEEGSHFAPDKFWIRGESKKGAIIQFQISYFPGWKIWINGAEALIDTGNKISLITISIPPGLQEIQGVFTDTLPRFLGNILSLFFVIGLLFIWILRIYGRRCVHSIN